MDRPGNPAQWNISRLWPLSVKSPAQSLDYRANSYHIHLNTLGFHGYGEEISQICPCPFCPINSSFSGTPSPSHHSTAQLYFPGGGAAQELQELQRKLISTNFEVFNHLPCEEMAINFAVPEVSSSPYLLYFYHTLVHPNLFYWTFFFFFCSSFYP